MRWGAFFLQHKCALKHIIPSANRPITILQKIDGHYVTNEGEEIAEQEAVELLCGHSEFVCKVAIGSGGGHGVVKMTAPTTDAVKGLLKREDLIFQEVLRQSAFMTSFNPDSVNTIRLLTLNINNRCTLLSAFIRMGGKGSFVDNLCSGQGALVGINKAGELAGYGITKSYSKVQQAPSGLKFEGLKVPEWEAVTQAIIDFHRHIPYANLIGWDVALDEDGRPVVLEINLDSAEIEAHQVFNGPVFGDRLEEVRNYLDRKRPLLRHATITY